MSDPSVGLPDVGPSPAVDPDNPDLIIVGGTSARTPRCHARVPDNFDGRCTQPAVRGATVCKMHGGAARHVREAGYRRWSEQQRLKAITEAQTEVIGDPVVKMAEVAGDALVILEWSKANIAAGEDVETWLPRLGQALDRSARILAECGRLGLEERRVRLEEDKLDMLAAVMVAFLRKRGFDPDATDVQADLDAVYREIGSAS